MDVKDAKKTLDSMKYDLAKGTRRLVPGDRAAVKEALNTLAAAGETYTKPKKASRKALKPEQ